MIKIDLKNWLISAHSGRPSLHGLQGVAVQWKISMRRKVGRNRKTLSGASVESLEGVFNHLLGSKNAGDVKHVLGKVERLGSIGQVCFRPELIDIKTFTTRLFQSSCFQICPAGRLQI